jgi:hypothetical protein
MPLGHMNLLAQVLARNGAARCYARVLAQVPAGVLARVLARFYGVCALPLTLDPQPSVQSTSSKPSALNLDKSAPTSTQVAVAFTAAGSVEAVAVRVGVVVCAKQQPPALVWLLACASSAEPEPKSGGATTRLARSLRGEKLYMSGFRSKCIKCLLKTLTRELLPIRFCNCLRRLPVQAGWFRKRLRCFKSLRKKDT